MKKIVRLTESDLIRLVKRVIKEQGGGIGRDENFEFNDSFVLLRDLDQRKVQHYLSKLPETIRFLAIIDCEGVDFSSVDLCSFPELTSVNVKGTPNNLEENVDCKYVELDGLYSFV